AGTVVRQGFFDLNGNGVGGEVIRSGAADLALGLRIPTADGSVRQALGGRTLAFTQPIVPPGPPDMLRIYDATLSPPETFGLGIGSGPIPLLRTLVGDVLAGQTAIPQVPVDLAVTENWITFAFDEGAFGSDLDGDGTLDGALVLYHVTTGDLFIV